MKEKATKPAKQTKAAVQVKDIKPKKDAKGGIGLLLPAVQKVREAAHAPSNQPMESLSLNYTKIE